MIEGMNHFTITAEDREATLGFYCGLLGLVEGPRPDLGFPGAWLYPPGGQQAVLHIYWDRPMPSLRTGVMGLLIDVLNEMQQWVAGDTSLAGSVQWVDLRGTLSTDPEAYLHDWANELHPTEAGFAALADRVARAIG